MPDIGYYLHQISINALPVIIAITFHEAAHGYVAYRKGDPTAKMLGRVTLNPLPHIDPIGTILIPGLMILLKTGFIFGWARPVPVNFRLLRDQKRDPIYVSAAGVVTNLGLAAISGIVFRILIAADPGLLFEGMRGGVAGAEGGAARMVTLPLALMCIVSVQFNVLLAVFNMIPIPPLDGGRIAVMLLPPRASMGLASMERYGMLIIVALFMFGPVGIIWRFVQVISSFILGG
ncbi:MAG: site-2 protease family protein [Thermodesulfobacteriota bacterium]